MKYRVYIVPPKAQRLKNSRVFLEISGGFDGCSFERLLPKCNTNVIEFEVEDDIKAYPSGWIDATEFRVCVEYSNSTGSRKEKIYLVPEIINDSIK